MERHTGSQYPKKMASVVEKHSAAEDNTPVRDHFPSVLREKMPNNNGVYNFTESSWACDLDIYREKLKAQQNLPLGGQRTQYLTKCRYSEGEKEGSDVYDDTMVKRRIRTRSESEPNDIRNMQYWATHSELVHGREDKLYKRDTREMGSNIRDLDSSNASTNCKKDKLPPAPPSSIRRESPSRILLHNQTGCIRRGGRFRSPSMLSSPKLNGIRRCKTKSPSPRRRTTIDTMNFRKARSATPPSKSIMSLSSVPATDKCSMSTKTSENSLCDKTDESDDSCVDDDDDFDDVGNDCKSSSDSEDGYRVYMYLSPSEKQAMPSNFLLADNVVPPVASPFVPSLFPNVPPYLAFSPHNEKRPPLSPELYKILKWKYTSIMPKVVAHTVINSGFRLLKKTNDWMATWGRHMKSPCFKAIRSYQKINHLPGSYKIGRKDSCWKNLQKQMVKHGKKEFGFMPKTYIIPQDLKALRKAWPKYSQRNFKWIIKPPACARGTGIKVVNKWAQIPKRKPIIVQRYIERPLLINGSKFDIRLYVLVTSINPLRVYMYHEGLARFASVKYSDRADTLSDRCMHLTNYSINKFSSNYHKNDDVNACNGHKWTLKSLWTYLASQGVNTNRLWGVLRNLVLRTILAGEHAIYSMIKLNVESKYSCFELFGFDVLLDSELVPWLLEVNISPSLHSDLPLDIHVKAPLVQAVLNTALYQIPPKLTLEQQKNILQQHNLKAPLCYDKRLYISYLSSIEKLKHNQFTRKDLDDRNDYLNAILENLTPDDVRCLITSEDELSRCKPLERIFPTQQTYKYLKYTEYPRYYNRLLDAWEHRYGKNRKEGIQLLRKCCENKFHLEVPPSPVKRQLKIRPRTIRGTSSVHMAKMGWTLKTTIKSIKRKNRKLSMQRKLKTKDVQSLDQKTAASTSVP